MNRAWHRLDPKPTATHVVPTQNTAQSETSVQEPVSEDDPKAKLHRNKAQLENLPAEIRRQLLSMLEYEGLKVLVHASPTYHQQYLLDHQHLLSKCLETTLGSSTIDACAVYQSGLVDFLETRTEKKITQFLESYQDHRLLSQYSFPKMLTSDNSYRW